MPNDIMIMLSDNIKKMMFLNNKKIVTPMKVSMDRDRDTEVRMKEVKIITKENMEKIMMKEGKVNIGLIDRDKMKIIQIIGRIITKKSEFKCLFLKKKKLKKRVKRGTTRWIVHLLVWEMNLLL